MYIPDLHSGPDGTYVHRTLTVKVHPVPLIYQVSLSLVYFLSVRLSENDTLQTVTTKSVGERSHEVVSWKPSSLVGTWHRRHRRHPKLTQSKTILKFVKERIIVCLPSRNPTTTMGDRDAWVHRTMHG